MPGSSLQERLERAFLELGFNRSEVRLYLALLKKYPATGYELAARSGVPRAAIYHTLQHLEENGLVFKVQEKPARYQPIDPERLAEILQARFESRLEALREGLKNLAPRAAPAGTWSVTGYRTLIEQARALLAGSRQSVHASLWRREAKALAEPLRRARQSLEEVVLFSFTPLDQELGQVFSYGIPEAELEKHWPHKIILIVDRDQALLGGAQDTEDNQAVVTREPALVEMAVSNLVLDLTLYGQRFGKDTSRVVAGLTRWLAPVEKLAGEAARRPERA